MNDIRRTILWVIFGMSMVLLWDQWQIYNGHAATFFPQRPTAAPTASSGSAQTAPSGAGQAGVPGAAGSGAAAVPGAVPVAGAQAVPTPQATVAGSSAVPAGAQAASQRAAVRASTDVLAVDFDTEGGSVTRLELLKHAALDGKAGKVVMLDSSRERVYLAQSGLIAGAAGGAFPTHKTPMSGPAGPLVLADGQDRLEVRFESQPVGGVVLVKTYTLQRGSYAVAVRHEVINQSGVPVNPQLYVQLVRDGNKPPGDSAFYSTFTGPAIYTEAKKYEKVEFSDIEKGKAEHVKSSANGFVAMVQHYFASAWLLADGVSREIFTRKVDTNLYAVGMIIPLQALAPAATQAIEARLFVGPQEEKTLEQLAPGLELVKDYGWLTILAKPLYWLLDKLHGMLGNWGWAIVALVLLLKIAFYWLNAKAYESMAKMKAVSPRIMEMRERLKDNPQQMQLEMMKIYREEKVNPMGGCFPIMVQIPVFIALYWVLLSSVEMRNAPWIGWIRDLSAPDPWFVLPVLMTLTTMLQTALNPVPPDPMQAKLMWFMPLAFSVMFFFFPSGLVLYWITNNILSIAQQWIINTRMGVPPQFNLPKFK